MERIARRITERLFAGKVDSNKKIEIYNYAITLLLTTVITGVATILISSFVFSFIEAVVFVLIFAFVRVFSGGYHCSTYVACFIVTVMTAIITISSSRLLLSLGSDLYKPIAYCVMLISCSVIVYFAPSPNPKKKVTKRTLSRNRVASFISVLSLSISNTILLSLFEQNETIIRIVFC